MPESTNANDPQGTPSASRREPQEPPAETTGPAGGEYTKTTRVPTQPGLAGPAPAQVPSAERAIRCPDCQGGGCPRCDQIGLVDKGTTSERHRLETLERQVIEQAAQSQRLAQAIERLELLALPNNRAVVDVRAQQMRAAGSAVEVRLTLADGTVDRRHTHLKPPDTMPK